MQGPGRLPRIIAITDDGLEDDALVEASTRALAGCPAGQMAIQLRAAGRSGQALVHLAERLQRACEAAGAPLLINDRLDVALAVAAAGVHLGRASVAAVDARRLLGANTLVTRSAHAPGDVASAAIDTANAVLLSPIFASPGKGEGRGTDWLRAMVAAAPALPVFALGGVGPASASSCVREGAYGVAVIRAVFRASDPAAAAKALAASVYAAAQA